MKSSIGTIEIHKNDITKLNTDAVVNAANSGLQAGGGVCGAIFRAAGHEQLQEACDKIGHCRTGSAVITPAFNMKNNKYIIHAVGPRYFDGHSNEPEQLYSCYQASLELAKEKRCRSIGFPLISSGIFGYPMEEAWRIALTACKDYLEANPAYPLQIVFVNRDDHTLSVGKTILQELNETATVKNVPEKQDNKSDIQREEHNGDIHKRRRIFICDAGKFRETKGYQFIADFADDKTAGSYVQYMRGKKRYADKDIIVREITVKKTNSGEETELGKILEVIAVTGESLPVGEYTFS